MIPKIITYNNLNPVLYSAGNGTNGCIVEIGNYSEW